MIDILTVFNKKTELLVKGLYLDEDLRNDYSRQGIEIDFGRKGGAGPLGGRYFLFEEDTLVNVALWNNSQRTNLNLAEKLGDFHVVRESKNHKDVLKLKLVQNPQFYDPTFLTSDGIPMKKIALVHGVDCLASTIYQKCVYWACGEACKFCGLEISLNDGSTILEKKASQMNEVIKVAKKEERCSHMTLTSGTDESPDKGAKRYVEMLRGIKEENPDLPLHVQIEPVEDLSYIDELKDAGADTIGIHIEILDETIRKQITPGKSRISRSLFETNWNHALETFGKNQVETFILTGFGESPEKVTKELKKIVSIGVIPFITPVRSIPGRKNLPKGNIPDLKKIYLKTAEFMKSLGVNPLEHKAGCVRCGGCSAITEAYKVA
ncbi:MAG: radical SAM protein [Promethearchaeota archaeon]|nr:MAG: radical SAM protein [Candidatus Lokiarchaeota archaeon]